MRKNHHGKKDRLVKRVFALCLALAVICTCLVPVFATEDLIDPQVNQEASRPVDDGEASYPDDEFAGFGGDEAAGFGDDFPAVDDGEPREVYDEGEAAGFGEDEVATRPVEDGEDNLDGGPTVTDSEWGTVIDYSTSTSTDPSTSTETQWSGEDDVVEKPDDKVVVSGDEIKKLQDMVVYRFWLKELNANDLQDITAQAQINNMTESEYLARNGEVLWNLYFIQAVLRAETIADYSSYIENPSSNRDPKGELRQFDYWYTLDEFGNRVRLNLTDPTSNILDDKTTTVNVYAAWKDGTVGSDEEEDVDHEDLVDKNPVPVDLTAKASTSYEDEDGNTKSVNLPVEVKNLPSATHRLSVTHMGDHSMTEFCNTYVNELQGMQPLLGLKITPEDINSEKVQLAKGQKATVTVSGLNELPDIAEMEEMGALNADALKVLHQKDDGTVEILDVLTYTNGTLTFETSSFSPFVVASKDGYATDTLDTYETFEMTTAETKQLTGRGASSWYKDHNWSITPANSDVITLTQLTGYPYAATIVPLKEGTVTVTHTCKTWRNETITDTFVITITRVTQKAAIYFLSTPNGLPESNATKYWSPTSDTSQLLGEISVNENANYWVGQDKKNITNNVGSYILKWPDETTSGDSWTLTSEDKSPMVGDKKAFNYVLDSIWDSYKAEIAKDLGVGADTLSKGDISQITLNAFKISRDNSTTENQYFHIDCTLDIKSSKVFTAKFMVKYPGNTDYTLVDAKNYVTGNSVSNTSVVDKSGATPEVRSTYTDSTSGITYQLSGWYTEKDGGPYNATNKKDLKQQWSYEPSVAELLDGTVYFYAHYEPISADLTVTKTVTGMLGDTNKAFTFQILDASGEPVELTTGSYEFGNANGALLTDGTDGKFTLKDGASIIFNRLPVGTYNVYELDDEGTLQHYQTTWTGADTELTTPIEGNGERKATVTIGADGAKTLAFTNHATLEPDTGVLLDTLPYIVILAVVAGGVALLMLRKRRKEDD